MNFEQILDPHRISVGVEVSNKKHVLEEISRLLALGTDALNADSILGSLAGREKLGSTGLGHGVAIPHGRVPGVTSTVGAFVQMHHPVDYDAHDGNYVDIVFGLLVPEKSTQEHLQHLAAVAEKLSDETFCRQIRDAESPDSVMALFTG